MRKKFMIVMLTMVCLLSAFGMTGCSTTQKGTKGGKVQEYNFPTDGIVKKEAFDAIKGTVNTDVYKGSADGGTYVWTFNGKDIDNPMDFNITIAMKNDAAQQVQQATGAAQVQGFAFSDNVGVPGKYNLRINLGSKWDCPSIDLYHLDGTKLDKVGTVYKEDAEDQTKVNFGLTTAQGQFYLVSGTQVADPDSVIGTENAVLTNEEANQLKQNIIDQDSNYNGKTDQYGTQLDNIPEGKPGPSEQRNINYQAQHSCTFSIDCSNIWDSKYNGYLDSEKAPYQPKDGKILSARTVTFYEGESVFDVLQRECQNNGIHLEYAYTPMYGSNYIEGINNLYEFDCGELSGWMYCVNGWYPNYGCSRYALHDGDVVEWHYTCDLGRDLPGGSIY